MLHYSLCFTWCSCILFRCSLNVQWFYDCLQLCFALHFFLKRCFTLLAVIHFMLKSCCKLLFCSLDAAAKGTPNSIRWPIYKLKRANLSFSCNFLNYARELLQKLCWFHVNYSKSDYFFVFDVLFTLYAIDVLHYLLWFTWCSNHFAYCSVAHLTCSDFTCSLQLCFHFQIFLKRCLTLLAVIHLMFKWHPLIFLLNSCESV